MERQHITIIGGGIAGLTTAIALKRIGRSVTVFEAAPTIRPIGSGISLAPNALSAFGALGLSEALQERGHMLRTFHILDHRGRTLTRTSVPEEVGPGILCIHRADLHAFLMEQLEPGDVRLGRRTVDVHQDAHRVIVTFADGTQHRTPLLIAADGVRSVVRGRLIPGVSPRHAGYVAWRGEVEAPVGMAGTASETWGPKGRFGIVPLGRGRVYWFATTNAAADDHRLAQYRVTDLQRHFAGYHPAVRDVLARATDGTLIHGPIQDLPAMAHFAHGRVLFIGDAAHATTPNMGQGACQAIEDAVVLAHALRTTPDAAAAFRAFEQERMPRTEWVVRNSRSIGAVGQWAHPLAIALRNRLIRQLPPSFGQSRSARINDVRFEPLPATPPRCTDARHTSPDRADGKPGNDVAHAAPSGSPVPPHARAAGPEHGDIHHYAS